MLQLHNNGLFYKLQILIYIAPVVGEEPRLEGTEVEAVLQQLLHETVNELTESFN